jgi:putative FmdB family regulatory protein
MIYPHECSVCKKEFEVIKPLEDFDKSEYCPECGMIGIRVIAKRQAFYGASDWDTRHYNQALGMVVKSNKEAQKLARERGWVEIGNEPVEKIHKKFDSEREHKLSTAYDSILEPITVTGK